MVPASTILIRTCIISMEYQVPQEKVETEPAAMGSDYFSPSQLQQPVSKQPLLVFKQPLMTAQSGYCIKK